MGSDKMMLTRGVVTNTDQKGYACVVLNRQSACSHCSTKKSKACKSSLTGSKMEVTVLNTMNAQKGDMVTITLSKSKMLKGAAALYLIPVTGLLSGAFIGVGLQEIISLSETAAAMSFGFLGLALGFYIVKKISENYYSGKKLPQISSIIKPVDISIKRTVL